MKREQKQMVDLEAFEIVRAERDGLQTRLDNEVKAARELAKKNEDLLAALVAHTNHASELEKESNALRRDLQLSREATNALRGEIKRLKAQAAEAHDQFQKRVGELAATSAAAMQEVEARKARAKGQQELLDQQRADYERALFERDKARQEVKEKSVQLETVEARLAENTSHFKRQAEKMLLDIDALKKSNKALNARNAELLTERDQLLDEAGSLERALKAEQTWKEVTKATNEGLMAAEKDLRDKIKAQEEVIERLKDQNVRFVEERREIQDRAAKLTKDLTKAKEDVSRLVGLLDDFKKQLAAVQRARESVCSELMVQQAMVADMQADYEARGRVIKKLRKRLHKLKKKLKH